MRGEKMISDEAKWWINNAIKTKNEEERIVSIGMALLWTWYISYKYCDKR
jgi:hypothetical protein